MKIVLTGAGSGGHITPVLAVADELKQLDPKLELIYIGQTGDSLGDIPAKHPAIDTVHTVRAGKFRRYHGEGWKQLLDFKTMALNARDGVYVLIGLYQSWRLLRQLRPAVIFIKGGFVGVPIGLAAAQLGIPYVTHDSDAIPGLANRIIGRWASKHAVALPKKRYAYPADKTVTTGIPLQATFKRVTPELQKRYRAELELPASAKILFVIGGGLGSQRVNQAVAEAMPHLLSEFPDLYVVQSVGRANEEATKAVYAENLPEKAASRLQVRGYIDDVYRYSGAADIVITRAGATNLAEFAVQGKATIVVPSPFLTGGHQLKNATFLEEQGAAIVLQEDELLQDPHRLAKQVSELLRHPEQVHQLGDRFARSAQPHATQMLAQLILDEASQV